MTRVLTAISAVVLCLLVVPGAPARAASALIVHTDKGDVLGRSGNGVDDFLGIPYAAPPVGARRWQPPAPARVLERSSRRRPSTVPRAPPLESTNGARSERGRLPVPQRVPPDRFATGAHLPVYVFIHGGGLVNGSSNQAGGEKIVREDERDHRVA